MYKKTIVLKFGGLCLGPLGGMTPHLENIKREIKKYTEQDYTVVAVFSAPKGMTRELNNGVLDALDKEHPNYKKHADSVLGIGEQVSTQILNSFLNSHNVKTKALINETLPITTDSNFGSANILDIKTSLIYSAFEQNDVVIVPGYIGKDIYGTLTTLGFDGSDTTAIYLADAIKAQECILYKDVEGVFSIRPDKINQSIEHYDEINIKDMITYSFLGGRIVSPKGLIKAQEKNNPIRIESIYDTGNGTLISGSAAQKGLVGATYLNGNVKQPNGIKGTWISLVGEKVSSFQDELSQIIKQNPLKKEQVLKTLKKEFQTNQIYLPTNSITYEIPNKKVPEEMLQKIYTSILQR